MYLGFDANLVPTFPAQRGRLQRVREHVERLRRVGQRRETRRGRLLGQDQDGRHPGQGDPLPLFGVSKKALNLKKQGL